MRHKTSEILSSNIGLNTEVWQFCIISSGAFIGDFCKINSHCLIENDVVIGDRVTIKSGVQIWDGIEVQDNVIIGANTTFESRINEEDKTLICEGASIGANATILPGITIGKKAMIGAGSVVTESVPPNAIVKGNPARITGYVGVEIHSEPLVTTSQQKELDVSGASLFNLKHVPDMRGHLCVGEVNNELPFVPKRLFYIFDVPSSKVRGAHAHKECHQLLICLRGSINVVVDNGTQQEEVVLDKPNAALLLEAGIWGVQYKYSKDAILLVLASHEYDADDYIRDYDEFIKWTQANK